MTPSEMFVAGRWNHDEFYNYLSTLATLLPEGVLPMGVHPDQFIRGLAFANGGYVKNPATRVPGYLNEPFLESGRLLQRLIHSGLTQGPGFAPPEEDGGVGAWSFGAAHFPGVVPQFNEGNLAMTILQRWQFYGTSAHVEFGIIPFPWGSNVQFPTSGNWQDLRDYGYNSFVLDANLLLLVEGTPAVVTHDIAQRIIFSYNLNMVALESIAAFRAGEPDPTEAPNLGNLFEDIDRELWQWYALGPVLCQVAGGNTPPAFFTAFHNALGANTDLRPALEAVVGEDVWHMLQMGSINIAHVPESVRLQAEEFGVWLAEQPDEDE
jgi:hypothetical protein